MVNKVSVVLDVATEKGVAAIKGIRQSVSEADGAFGKLKAGGASAFDSIKANAALAGTAVVGAIAVMAAKSIQAASDLSESINAVNVTFGKSADGILKLGEAAAEAVGLSNSQFNGLAVQFSSFANTVAGEGGDVVGTIDDMTHRVADFASVMNIDVPRAGEVFQSALAGEQEGIKKFGIDMSAATVEQFAFANGIAKVGDQLTETQKVQARYGLLMQATEKVAGDFANTADGLANSQRILAAKTTDTAAKFGNALKPAMEAVVPVLIDTLDAAAELAPAFQAASDQVADVVKGAKPLVDALGLIASGAGDAAAGFEAVDEKTGNWLSKISGKVMTDALKNTLFGPIVGTGLQAKDMFDKLIGSTDKAAVSLDHLDERSYAYGAAVETVIVDLDHLDERHQTATSSTESHQIAIDNAAKASVDYKGALQDVADAMDEQIEATNALVGGDIAVRDAQREAAAAVAELTAAQGDQSLSADELSAAQDGAAESLIGAARGTGVSAKPIGLLIFLKGKDTHDYKFSSAVLEDYLDNSLYPARLMVSEARRRA
jgi:hypothetical protein